MKSDLNTIINEIYDNGYSLCCNFLTEQEVNEVLSRFKVLKDNNRFKKAGIGSKTDFQKNEEVRSDDILWLDEKDEFFERVFFSKIIELIPELNRTFFLGLKSFEFHLAHYKEGTFYKRHKDVFKKDDARKISLVCYLNKDWKKEDGGELILYLENDKQITIAPLAGSMIVFESTIEHEVLPSKKDRYSITGWIKNTIPIT